MWILVHKIFVVLKILNWQCQILCIFSTSRFGIVSPTEILCTKIHIYKQQEIGWKCFYIYYPYRLLEIWVWRKKIHVLRISLKKLFSKHKNGLGHLKASSDWAKNWISWITFHIEWENQLKVGSFRLLAHQYYLLGHPRSQYIWLHNMSTMNTWCFYYSMCVCIWISTTGLSTL